jgi:type II secretory pathway pseudopilin PulG
MFPSRKRAALTLIELLIATSIMAIMAAVLGGLAMSVQMQSEHSQSHGEAVQHARIVLDRLQRTINEARTSESFPGFLVVPETVSGHSLPDTLVVWHPTGAPVDPTGLPRWSEVVVFCPDPTAPQRLLEITSPSDSRPVPALAAISTWRSELSTLKNSSAANIIELTTLMRTANLGSSGAPNLRAALRFDQRLRPGDDQWAEYKAATRDWDEIDWVQSIHGTKTGLRQNWCRIEIQLQPQSDDPTTASAQTSLTFFGSASVYQKMYHD